MSHALMEGAVLHLIEAEKLCYAESLEVLSPDEILRAKSFVFTADRERWAKVRAEVKSILSRHLDCSPAELKWDTHKFGKPALKNDPISFSLSHSKKLSTLLVCKKGPVGVDIEQRARGCDLMEAVDSFCHPRELAALPENNPGLKLIDIWTAKEAFLKALGTGFTQPPEEIYLDGVYVVGPLPGLSELHLLRPTHPILSDYTIAAAVPRDIHYIEICEHRHLP